MREALVLALLTVAAWVTACGFTAVGDWNVAWKLGVLAAILLTAQKVEMLRSDLKNQERAS